MTHEISLPRMSHLSMYDGTIGVEGEGEDIEIVVRIPFRSPEMSSDVYYELGNMW